MQFEINQEIINDIVFAMENQNDKFYFDSKEKKVVDSNSINLDNQDRIMLGKSDLRFYTIPHWDSVSGFRMMERFVVKIQNPEIKNKLREILASRQGVFKGFKNFLKQNPDTERQWFSYKSKYMNYEVVNWYNSLLESWGLEKIGDAPEPTEDIVMQDFVFRDGNLSDYDDVLILIEDFRQEIKRDYSIDLATAIVTKAGSLQREDITKGSLIIVETVKCEVVGFIFSKPVLEEGFSTINISNLFVKEDFRSLGLGKELLDKCLEYWQNMSFFSFFAVCSLMPSYFFYVFYRNGFVDKGHLLLLEERKS